MVTKLRPKSAETPATIKKVQSLILRKKFNASELGIPSGNRGRNDEQEKKYIPFDEMRAESPYTSQLDFLCFRFIKTCLTKTASKNTE
ncbi:hypothetical protein TNCV_4487651 [Trichonephila clavipes]|nr:hypothetical protein TNCV_4487651 [Trichonephila clavipes]